MNASAIIDRVQANLNRDDATTALVLEWLNNRQTAICNIEDFSFMEVTATANCVKDQQSYIIPDDYKSELHLWLVETSGAKTPLVKWVGTEAEKNYSQDDTSGKPTNYWVWDDAYFLYPIPDDTYSLMLKYYEYVNALTDTASELNELCSRWPDLLINGATSDGFHYFHQPDKTAEWESKYSSELSKFLRRNGKRKYANYNPRMRLRIR